MESIRLVGREEQLHLAVVAGFGEEPLMQYSQDLRGHVARHARAVLEDVRFPAPKER